MKQPGITQRVWLFMLENGGHWTTAELAEQTGDNASHLDRILWSMHRVGSVTKYRNCQRKNGTAFGVSQRNRIPHGLALQEVLGAAGIRQVIDRPANASNDARRSAA